MKIQLETRGDHLAALEVLEALFRPRDELERKALRGAFADCLADAIDGYEQIHYPLGWPEKFPCPTCKELRHVKLNERGDDAICTECGTVVA
jgi:hypothetical protein